MSEFKEYHNANHHDGDNTFDDQTYKMTNGEDFDDQFVQDCFDHFKAGQQSQQAKIDCMQVRLDGANERALSILNHKNVMVDKMQAEIDEFKKLRSLDEMAINQLAQANQVWQIKCDELQKRIDDASNKIDFLGVKSDSYDNFETLISKDETWSMGYLRHPETLHSWKGFTIAGLIPILGWFYILHSMYEAVKIYTKHWRK